MASRYWVGGTAAWDGTAGTKWALTSGGAGGQAVPTNADDVFLDANSGAVTVTVQTAVGVGGSVNCTGFTGTLVQSTNLNIGSATAGDFILSSTMTYTWTAGAIKLTTTKVSNTTIDLAGRTVGNFTINGNGASFVLANDITASLACAFSGGTVDFNGHNVTCGNLSNGNTLTRTVNMRGGSITITGTGAIFDSPAGTLIFTWTTGAKFVIANTSASAKTFAGGTNTTYPLIEVAGAASAGTVTFSGAFTAAGFIWDALCNAVYTSGTTFTVSSITGNGTSGNLSTITATTPGSPATISIVSGIINVPNVSLKDSTASGGASFYASGSSVNVSGNTGWTFGSPPSAISVSEATTTSEAVSMVLISLINISDTATMAENVSLAPTLVPAVVDSTVTSEEVSMVVIVAISPSDSTATSEAVSISIIAAPSVFDATSLTEAVSMLITSSESVFDSVSTSEAISMLIKNYASLVSDATATSEAVALVITSPVSVSDSTATSESVQMSITTGTSIFDAATTAEAVVMRLISALSVADATATSESVTLKITSTQGVFDSVSTQEAVSMLITKLSEAVFDSVSTTENVTMRVIIPVVAGNFILRLGIGIVGYSLRASSAATSSIVRLGVNLTGYTLSEGTRTPAQKAGIKLAPYTLSLPK